MRNTVFLVNNGIGYGHLRRALILAEALLDAGQVRPIIISQAGSLDIYANTRVPLANFPLLHRVPSAVAEDGTATCSTSSSTVSIRPWWSRTPTRTSDTRGCHHWPAGPASLSCVAWTATGSTRSA